LHPAVSPTSSPNLTPNGSPNRTFASISPHHPKPTHNNANRFREMREKRMQVSNMKSSSGRNNRIGNISSASEKKADDFDESKVRCCPLTLRRADKIC
jgi:hypothetical protein